MAKEAILQLGEKRFFQLERHLQKGLDFKKNSQQISNGRSIEEETQRRQQT